MLLDKCMVCNVRNRWRAEKGENCEWWIENVANFSSPTEGEEDRDEEMIYN